MISLLQRPIENKLSSLLGGEVSFQSLKLSPLKGALEARGVSVAGEERAEPWLTIRRLRAQVSVPQLLRRQLVVKSLSIEGPVISIIQRPDGSTNLPRRRPEQEHETSEMAPDEEEGQQISSWALEARSVLLSDGEAHYRVEPAAGEPAYHVAMQGMNGEVAQQEERLTFSLRVGSCGRMDRPVELGPGELTGGLRHAGDLSRLAVAEAEARLRVGERLKAQLTSAALGRRAVSVDLEAQSDVSELLALLPPGPMDVERLLDLSAKGTVRLAVIAHYDPDRGLRIPRLELHGTDLSADV